MEGAVRCPRHMHVALHAGAVQKSKGLGMQNGSLEDSLRAKRPPGRAGPIRLTWPARTRLAAELANALHYLHTQRPEAVLHGGVRPSNVLLADDTAARLGDVGLPSLLHEAAPTVQCPCLRKCSRGPSLLVCSRPMLALVLLSVPTECPLLGLHPLLAVLCVQVFLFPIFLLGAHLLLLLFQWAADFVLPCLSRVRSMSHTSPYGLTAGRVLGLSFVRSSSRRLRPCMHKPSFAYSVPVFVKSVPCEGLPVVP